MMKHCTLAALAGACLLSWASWGGGAGAQEYEGAETCLECHEEAYETYTRSIHSVAADPRTPAAKGGCEVCHGSGAAHVAEDGEGPIFALKARAAASAARKSAACLQCHRERKLTHWYSSEHESRRLSCSDCHTIHREESRPPDQAELCIRCHKRVRADLWRQSHHPVREGKIRCTDCHNPHGTVGENLVEDAYTNTLCFRCHQEKRGPFLWEHPSAVEDCLACHTPHGSSRGALLKAKAPYLCQRCHSNSGHAGMLYARRREDGGHSLYRVSSNRVFYRACLNCHVAVHGSNHPSGKTLLR